MILTAWLVAQNLPISETATSPDQTPAVHAAETPPAEITSPEQEPPGDPAAEEEPSEETSAGTEPADTKSADAEPPAEPAPADAKAVETEPPAEPAPVESQPADTQPADTEPPAEPPADEQETPPVEPTTEEEETPPADTDSTAKSAPPGLEASSEPETVIINFSNANLKEVIKVFEQYTGQRFLFSESVVANRQINLISSKPIPVDSIINVFESILEIQGLTLVKTGEPDAEIFKIIEVTKVAGKPTPLYKTDDLEEIPDRERVVTLIYQLKFIQAGDVAAAFKNMTSVPEGIQAISGANILRITDYASNVKRIGDLLSELDAIGPEIARKTIKLENVDPAMLVAEIQPILDIENRIYMSQLQKKMESQIKQLMSRMSKGGRGSAGGLLSNAASPIAVAAIPRLGSVIVSATEDKIDEIEELIKSLDIEDPSENVIAYYTVKYQKPSELAATLRNIFTVASGRQSRYERRDPRYGGKSQEPSRTSGASSQKSVAIVPDDPASRLIVVASKKTQEDVEAVIKRLDSVADSERELRYFPVAHADLDTLSRTVANIFGLTTADSAAISRWNRYHSGTSGQKRQGLYAAQDLILTDKNLSAIIVIAQKEILDAIAEMIEKLDVKGSEERTIVYYKLEYAEPAEIASAITSLLGEERRSSRWSRWPGTPQSAERPVTVLPNDKMRTVIVQASEEQHAEIKEIIANLDVPSAVLMLKYYAINHADIQQVAQTLGRLFKLPVGTERDRSAFFRSSRYRSQPGSTRSGLSDEPVIIPDENLHALIILTEEKTHALIAEALKKIDTQGPGERVTKYYKIKNSTASQVANVLSSLFPDTVQGGQTRSRRYHPGMEGASARQTGIVIVADDTLSTIVVNATEQMHASIEPVIKELDTEGPGQKKITYYSLTYASAEDIAQTLTTLYSAATRSRSRWSPRPRTSEGADTSIVVVPNEPLGTVIVQATDPIHKEIAEIIKTLDVEQAVLLLKYYPVQHAELSTLTETLGRLFKLGTGTAGQKVQTRTLNVLGKKVAAGLSDEPVIIPDENLQSLVVLAEEKTHALIADALKQLDVEGPGARITRHYPIQHVSAEKAASLLTELLKGTTAAASRRDTRSRTRTTAQPEDEAIVVADDTLSSVVVNAPQAVHDDVAAIIKSMDVEGPGTKKVLYYTLTYAKPEKVAETLMTLYRTVGGRTRDSWRSRRSTAGADTLREIIVVPDDKMGKLIVLATEAVHAEIKEIIANLDTESAELLLKYYPVTKADIREIAETIGRLFKLEVGADGAGIRTRRIPWRSAGRSEESTGGLSEEPVIIPDLNLNALIVLAEQKTHKLLEEVLLKLDVAGPGERITRYYHLTHNSAANVADTLSSLFSETSRPGSRTGRRTSRIGTTDATAGEPVIIVDEEMQTVVVSAPADMQERIATVITELDVKSPAAKTVAYYKLTYAKAEEIAETLRSLYDGQRSTSYRRRRTGAYTSGSTALDRTITVVANEKMRQVIVLAMEEVHEEIKEIIKNLDVESSLLSLKYYTLKHAELLDVAQILSRLYQLELGAVGTSSQARASRLRRTTDENTSGLSEDPVIIPEVNLNALIVLAEEKTHELVTESLAKLDVEGPGERITQYYRLKHNTASNIATTLIGLYSDRGTVGRSVTGTRRRTTRTSLEGVSGQPVILFDDNQATVIVSAPRQIQEEIAEIITQLDLESPNEKVVSYYALKYANPDDVKETLSQLYPVDTNRPGVSRTARRSTRPQAEETVLDRSITVVTQQTMRTVVVLAVPEVQEEIALVVKNLDVPGAILSLQYYPLEHAELDVVAQTISRLFQLDIGTATSLSRARSISRSARSGTLQPGLSTDPVLIPDTNLNALIILADSATHDLVSDAIKKLDVQGPGERVTRYYRIVNASVSEIANTLTSVFSNASASAGTTRRGIGARTSRTTSPLTEAQVIVVPNEELSMVVVSASEALHKEIAEVVESLDVESVRDSTIKYYAVVNQELEEVADTVCRIFGLTRVDDIALARTRRTAASVRRSSSAQRSPFLQENILVVDYNLASLIIIAPLEMHEQIQPVIEKIDIEGPGKREIQLYRVARSSVMEIANTIASIFDIPLGASSSRAGRSRMANGSAKSSVVIPNETQGSVIVVAPADIQKRVKEVIEGMDTIGPDENELQYYQIEKTDLMEAANIISQIFGIRLGTVEDTFRGTGQRQLATLLTKERVLIPNENLNTLLVVAPKEMQEEIAETIKKIDTVGPRDNIFKMYEVTVSEVTTAAKTISQLFDIQLLDETARVARSRRMAVTGPKVTTDPFIMPDEDLGSLIINAPEEIHIEIGKVLEKLVTVGRQEKMSIKFYRLKNTDPTEVATKIGNLFNITIGDATTTTRRSTSSRASRAGSTSRRGRTSLDEEEEERRRQAMEAATGVSDAPPAGSSTGTLNTLTMSKKDFYFEGESVVIPDTNLNSVILIAPQYIHEEVSKVLETLDVRRPQVLFEVAILDISKDGKVEIGTEIGTIDKQGATEARGHSFTNFGLSERTTAEEGGFPNATSVATDIAGLFVGITKGEVGNIPFLIRLLEQNTNVNIRSTPLLLVNDNEEAEFSSLTEQPTTSVSQGTATTRISFGGFESAGTVLKITPHVSEGEYIRVDIDLKVDNFYGEPIAAGVPPPRAANQLVTSITVPDSRTVVIGGLTTTKKQLVEKRIPILGAIPLLGYFFSSTSEQEVTSRLFLFLRPQIMDDVNFTDLNKISLDKSIEVQGITGEEIVEPEPPDGTAAETKIGSEEDESKDTPQEKTETDTTEPEKVESAEPENAQPPKADPAEATAAKPEPPAKPSEE